MAIFVIQSDLQKKIILSYGLDINLQQMIQQLEQGQMVTNFTLVDGLLRRKSKIVVGLDTDLKKHILAWLHTSAQGGHSRRDATLQRVENLFY